MEAQQFKPFLQILPVLVLDISPDRVLLSQGLFNKKERSVPMSKITDVSLQQNFFGGLFGIGNLYIQTAGSADAEIVVKGLARARAARDLLLSYIAKAD